MAKNYNFNTFSFSDFPEDIQLRILSFLSPSDLSSFACTSKRFVSLCHGDNGVWYAMCDVRWGSKTNLRRWFDPEMGLINFKLLFKTLSQYENLIGFWRRSGSESGIIGDAPLVFFDWGVSNVIGSRVAPSKDGSYNVIKTPFIWISLTPGGKTANYLKPPESDTIPVSLSLVEKGHVVLEESRGEYGNNNNNNDDGYRMNEDFGNVVDEDNNNVDIIGSPRDRLTSEMYQYFANPTSPRAAGERAWRRQRKREKGRRRWEAQHLVKVVHCSPTPSRPLQGLWKGICNDMTLDFYLVEYDDIGGIACRRVGESTKPCLGYAPIFWTSNAAFIDSPLSHEENYLYKARLHFRPTCEVEDIHKPFPLHIMYINSSYDLIAPNLEGISTNSQHVEGRIWQYIDGTFGFGFLCDNYIVDMKHMAKHGRLLNIDELCSG